MAVYLSGNERDWALEEYEARKSSFYRRAAELGLEDPDRYLWYHTIELGSGLVTPGLYDFRSAIDHMPFPRDMSGMRVLDVGPATGFFTFEFARRGADASSLELPSLDAWDMPSGSDREITLRELMDVHRTDDPAQLHHYHLDGPFRYCEKMLRLTTTRYYESLRDLAPGSLDGRQFDLVFIGDVLVHVFSPLDALARIAPFCGGELVISQVLLDAASDEPVAHYIGGDSRTGDCRTWWLPNYSCFRQILSRLGFREVDLCHEFDVVELPTCEVTRRFVIRARR